MQVYAIIYITGLIFSVHFKNKILPINSNISTSLFIDEML